MSSETYFVRQRGRVSGPFDLAELAKMARRGTLSSIDEISMDGKNWVTASTLERLFEACPRPRAQTSEPTESTTALVEPIAAPEHPGPEGHPAPMALPEVSPEAPSDAAPEERYYYSQGGNTIGPLSGRVLQSLALNGTLKPDDLVWAEGDQTSLPAHRAPTLSSIYSDARRDAGTSMTFIASGMATQAVAEAEGQSARILKLTNRLSLAGGLSAAVLLLFCLNTPRGETGGRLLWWWHSVGQSGNVLAVLFCFYVLFVSLSLLFLAPMLKGCPRGWVYVGAAGLGFPLLIAAGVVADAPNPSLLLPALLPTLCTALLVSALAYRSLEPEGPYARLIQASAGGLALVTTLAAIIIGVWIFSTLRSSIGHTPAWLIIVMVLSMTAGLCGILCGTLGVVGSRTTFSKRINTTAIILGTVALAMPVITGMIIGYGDAHTLPGGSRFALVRALRLVVMSYALVVLSVIGLLELLACTNSAKSRSQ